MELEIINHWVSYETPLAQIKENKMKLNTIGFITLLLIVGCKETGIHIVDNPDGTSVKVSYWAGNYEDNQPNIVKIGNRGSYMKVTHNVTFMTKYNTPLNFELENGQEVVVGDWEKLLAEVEEANKKGSSLRKILWMIRSK